MDENADKQVKKRGDAIAPYRFKKGQSGNPAGRPKTKTLKEYARDMLASMSDEERQNFFHGIDKKELWEMAEGKAPQSIDHTTLGKELPQPILKLDVLPNNSNVKDNRDEGSNSGSAGGNLSE